MHVDFAFKKYVIPYMLLAQNLQEIPANFTGIPPQNATQGFPITFMDKTFAVWIAENCNPRQF